MKRKDFLALSAIAAGTGTLAGLNACASTQKEQDANTVLDNLQPMTEGVQPITVAEREERIKKAQRLLKEAGMAALVLDSGTTMNYFTGIRWGRSERTMVAVIPAQGEVSYVCPGFEEGRMRELIKIGKQVYVWQEDENPSLQIIKAINEAGVPRERSGSRNRCGFLLWMACAK
ncbi:aminopeptidase P family N-terminal domain-containing protein [Salmonirosea aquatica]|uniref:aminopeptidase P family N-terminal domain-containing protein n=1 Tax=Salmonirosea aquatica TaxID=2654236 RepID=UPI003570F032